MFTPQYLEICATKIVCCQVLWQAASFKVGLLNDPVIDIFILLPVKKSYSTNKRCIRGILCFSIFEIFWKELFFFAILLFFPIHYVKQSLIIKVLSVKLHGSEYICNVVFRIYRISHFFVEAV